MQSGTAGQEGESESAFVAASGRQISRKKE